MRRPTMGFMRQISERLSSLYYPRTLPTQLYIFDVDPHCLHATWNIRREDLPRSAGDTAETALVLRLYRIAPEIPGASTDPSSEQTLVREIPLESMSNNHYIHPLRGGGLYRAEIGQILPGSAFTRFLGSNTIHVPPPRLRHMPGDTLRAQPPGQHTEPSPSVSQPAQREGIDPHATSAREYDPPFPAYAPVLAERGHATALLASITPASTTSQMNHTPPPLHTRTRANNSGRGFFMLTE